MDLVILCDFSIKYLITDYFKSALFQCKVFFLLLLPYKCWLRQKFRAENIFIWNSSKIFLNWKLKALIKLLWGIDWKTKRICYNGKWTILEHIFTSDKGSSLSDLLLNILWPVLLSELWFLELARRGMRNQKEVL